MELVCFEYWDNIILCKPYQRFLSELSKYHYIIHYSHWRFVNLFLCVFQQNFIYRHKSKFYIIFTYCKIFFFFFEPIKNVKTVFTAGTIWPMGCSWLTPGLVSQPWAHNDILDLTLRIFRLSFKYTVIWANDIFYLNTYI